MIFKKPTLNVMTKICTSKKMEIDNENSKPNKLSSFIIAQLIKNLPAMQETPVPFLGPEDPLEKG